MAGAHPSRQVCGRSGPVSLFASKTGALVGRYCLKDTLLAHWSLLISPLPPIQNIQYIPGTRMSLILSGCSQFALVSLQLISNITACYLTSHLAAYLGVCL